MTYFRIYVNGSKDYRLVRGCGEWYEPNPDIIKVGNTIHPWSTNEGTVILEITDIKKEAHTVPIIGLDVKHCGYIPGTEYKPRELSPWEKHLLGK